LIGNDRTQTLQLRHLPIRAADTHGPEVAAMKGAEVSLVEVRLANGLGGKAIALDTDGNEIGRASFP